MHSMLLNIFFQRIYPSFNKSQFNVTILSHWLFHYSADISTMITTFLLLLLTALISSYPPAESSASLYHKSFISSFRLGGWMKFIKQVLSPDTNMKQVLYRCDVVESCKCVCKLSNGSWVLIYKDIPADITDNASGAQNLCWTDQIPLIFPSSRKFRSFTGISENPYVAENLLGYYSSGTSAEDCCYSSEDTDSHLLIEFHVAQMVTRSVLSVQRISNRSGKWGRVEVRVGNYTGDFGKLQQLGDIYTDLPDPGEKIKFQGSAPIWGTHVLIRELEADKKLFFCGLYIS